MNITTNLATIELTAECSDGYRRKLILDNDKHGVLVALTSRLGIQEMGDIKLNAVVDKPVLVKTGVRYDLVGALVQRYLQSCNERERGRVYGVRNGVVLTYGEDDHYYVYETATQIVVQK